MAKLTENKTRPVKELLDYLNRGGKREIRPATKVGRDLPYSLPFSVIDYHLIGKERGKPIQQQGRI